MSLPFSSSQTIHHADDVGDDRLDVIQVDPHLTGGGGSDVTDIVDVSEPNSEDGEDESIPPLASLVRDTWIVAAPSSAQHGPHDSPPPLLSPLPSLPPDLPDLIPAHPSLDSPPALLPPSRSSSDTRALLASAACSSNTSAHDSTAAGRIFVQPTKADVVRDLPDFVCSICTSLAWEPIQTECHHIFCKSCLDEWLFPPGQPRRSICPMDRLPLAATNLRLLKSSNPFAWRVLGRIAIKCPQYESFGCEWIGEYSSAAEHLARSCSFAIVACRWCRTRLQRRHVSEHENGCPQKPIPCRFCKQLKLKQAMKAHVERDCSEAPIKCTGTKEGKLVLEDGDDGDALSPRSLTNSPPDHDGCGMVMPRSVYESHSLHACALARVQCTFASHGCQVGPMSRAALTAHLETNTHHHLQLVSQALIAETTRRRESEHLLERVLVSLTDWLEDVQPPTRKKKELMATLHMCRSRSIPSAATATHGNSTAASSSTLPSSSSSSSSSTLTSTPSSVSPSSCLSPPSVSSPSFPSSSLLSQLVHLSSDDLMIALQHFPPPPSTLVDSSSSASSNGHLFRDVLTRMDVGMKLDVRDSKGKWLEAQVITVQAPCNDNSSTSPTSSSSLSNRVIQVHYLNWSDRWDEWIDLRTDLDRIAPFHHFSSDSTAQRQPLASASILSTSAGSPSVANLHSFQLQDPVLVYAFSPHPRRWCRGLVWKLDGEQVSVRYWIGTNTYQRWHHVRAQEIIPLPKQSATMNMTATNQQRAPVSIASPSSRQISANSSDGVSSPPGPMTRSTRSVTSPSSSSRP